MARALVTGGGSGIGAATARRLAELGHDVIVADVDEASGRAVAAEIGGTFLGLDVARAEAWTAVPEVELAVLNAGVMAGPLPCSPDAWTDEVWARIRGVNVDGIVLGVRTVVPPMVARGVGSVVLTASLSGISPLPGDPLYSATKHFVIGLMRSTALQLAGTGVRISAMCPGATDTPIIPAELRGVSLLDPAAVAATAVELLEHGESGTAMTVPFGRDPAPWPFVDVPADLRPGAR